MVSISGLVVIAVCATLAAGGAVNYPSYSEYKAPAYPIYQPSYEYTKYYGISYPSYQCAEVQKAKPYYDQYANKGYNYKETYTLYAEYICVEVSKAVEKKYEYQQPNYDYKKY